MKKVITLYTSYRLPKEVQDAIVALKDDVSNGKLVVFDLDDLATHDDDSKWAKPAQTIIKFFQEQGETSEVYIHFCW